MHQISPSERAATMAAQLAGQLAAGIYDGAAPDAVTELMGMATVLDLLADEVAALEIQQCP